MAWLLLLVATGTALWGADRWISIRSVAIKAGEEGKPSVESGWYIFGLPDMWLIFLLPSLITLAIGGILWWALLDWAAQKTARLAYRERLQKLDEDEKVVADEKEKAKDLWVKAAVQIDLAKGKVKSAQEQAESDIKEVKRQTQLKVELALKEAELARLERNEAEKELERERIRKMNAMGKAQRLHRQKLRNQA